MCPFYVFHGWLPLSYWEFLQAHLLCARHMIQYEQKKIKIEILIVPDTVIHIRKFLIKAQKQMTKWHVRTENKIRIHANYY